MSENNKSEFNEISRILLSAVGFAFITIIDSENALQQGKDNQKNRETILREWQHEIFRKYGKSPCYGLFLILPYDLHAIQYLTAYSNELNQISGDNALLIAISKSDFKVQTGDPHNTSWASAIIEQKDGLSMKIANMFDVPSTELPCLLLFEDIRSSSFAKVELKGLSEKEIALRMREVFSIIQKSVSKKVSPINAINDEKNLDEMKNLGYITVSKLKEFAEKTFEAALKTWVETAIKQ